MNLKLNYFNKAAVIVPPIEDFYFTPHRFSSIGAQIVTGILKKNGIASDYFNFPLTNPGGTTIPIPHEFNYLKNKIIPNETGRCSFFTGYKRFGPPVQECAQKLLLSNPQICFFSCFSFCYTSPALKLAEEIKQLSPSTIVVFGGAGISAYPEFFLKYSYIDYTLCGEAEPAIPAFINYLTLDNMNPENVPGLGWRDDGNIRRSDKIIHTTGSNIICPIISTEFFAKSVHLTTSLSRGCPLHCSFCSNWLCHGKEFRRVSLENLESSLKETITPKDFCGNVYVNFEDDNLLLDYSFYKESMLTVKKYFPQAKFLAENGIDYRLIDTDKCRELISLGLSQFNFSLGSTELDILGDVNRSGNLERYDQLLSIASAHSIPVITYFICGFKQDTIETVASNLSFLYQRKTLIGISLYYPVPGIAGFEDRSVFDKVNPSICCGSAAYPWNNSLSTETLVTAFRLARFINLLKSNSKTLLETELIDSTFIKKRLHTTIREKKKTLVVEVPEQDMNLVKIFLEKIENLP